MRFSRKSPVVLMVCALFGAGSTGWAEGEGRFQLPEFIKVGVLHSRKTISLGCSGRCTYESIKDGKPTAMDKRSTLRIKGARRGMTVGKKTLTGGLQVTPAEPGAYVTVNTRVYRGKIFVRPRGGGVVDVIEQVPLENYLYGVLPREVGASWPIESLKAQAVMSRTFVVANMGKYAARGYDVSSDVYTQVYGGLEDERSATNEAVDATKGEILVDEQEMPVQTFFHSSCGGRTESPRYVWQHLFDAPAYFKSIPDPYCKEDPFYNWELNVSGDFLQRRLRRAGYRVGGSVRKVGIAKTSPSDRVWEFTVESSKGRTRIPGNSFRLAVGPEKLRSTRVTTIERRGRSFHFEGHGWGHGVGLCQWGARGRAMAGQSYTEIIDAYYPNVRLLKTDSRKNEP